MCLRLHFWLSFTAELQNLDLGFPKVKLLDRNQDLILAEHWLGAGVIVPCQVPLATFCAEALAVYAGSQLLLFPGMPPSGLPRLRRTVLHTHRWAALSPSPCPCWVLGGSPYPAVHSSTAQSLQKMAGLGEVMQGRRWSHACQ